MRKRRRWWLQFSLRGLLVFTFLVAVGLSLLKIYLAPYYRQKPAIDELRRLGVRFQIEPGEGPRWFGWLVGEDDFVRVVSVRWRNINDHLSGERLERLVNVFDRLPFLEVVDFSGDFTDAHLAHLQHADRLEYAEFRNSRIRGDGLRHLARATNLRVLNVFDSAEFGDAGLEQLKDHTELGALGLGGTRVTDNGIRVVSSFRRLKRLCLTHTAITDAGLAHLADLPRLEVLRLDGTRITDAGLKHLENLRTLKVLDVDNTAITGEGLVHLRRMRPGLSLHLDATQISDATAGSLEHLPARTSVELSFTPLSVDAIRELRERRPDLRVHLGWETRVLVEMMKKGELFAAFPPVECRLDGFPFTRFYFSRELGRVLPCRASQSPEYPRPRPPGEILILPDPAWPKKLDRVRRVAASASHTRAEPGACGSACLIAGATFKSSGKTRSTALVRSDHATGPDESGHYGPANVPLSLRQTTTLLANQAP